MNCSNYRPDIDGLRAIAVLSVVCFHAFPDVLHGGFIGVDIFFVISGFLISSIIFKSLGDSQFSFLEFYSRRIRRIFPALLVILIASYITGWFFLSADEYQQLGKHIAAGASFISNVVLWNENGYFDFAGEAKPLLHLWSLGVEEQFYILFPFLLWFAWKIKFKLNILIYTIALISFSFNIYTFQKDPILDFYSPLTRFWELMFGSILAHFHAQSSGQSFFNEIKTKYLSNIKSILGFSLLILSLSYIDKEKAFPGWLALFPVLGTVLLISAGAKAWANSNILSNRLLVNIGLISYPLYLWHWVLLSFSRILEGQPLSVETKVYIILISFILAYLTNIFIEKPLRFGAYLKSKTIFLIVSMSIMLFIGYATYKYNGFSFRLVNQQFQDFSYSANISVPEGFVSCEANQDFTNIQWCRTKNNSKPNAIVVGDSHALDKFHAIANLDKNRDWMFLGNNSCPPVLGIKVQGFVKDCDQKTPKIISWVIKNKDIDTVFLSFYGNQFLTTSYAADHIKMNLGPDKVQISSELHPNLSRSQIYYLGLKNTIEQLTKANKTVIIAIDVPELPFFPRDSIRNFKQNCTISRSEVDARQREHKAMIYALQKEYPQIFVYDSTMLFCNDEACSPKYNDRFLYRDSHHLSNFGGEIYAKRFLYWLNEVQHLKENQ